MSSAEQLGRLAAQLTPVIIGSWLGYKFWNWIWKDKDGRQEDKH